MTPNHSAAVTESTGPVQNGSQSTPTETNLQTINYIVMFLKTRGTNKTGNEQYQSAGRRWKVYLWQLPDDLISWYLPANDDNVTIGNVLRSFGISR